jgi:hypothetical protein
VIIYNSDQETFDLVGQGNFARVEVKGAYYDPKHGQVALGKYLEKLVKKEGEEEKKDNLIYWPKNPDFKKKPSLIGSFCYGPNDTTVAVEKYLWLVEDGCTNCGNNIRVSDNAEIFWSDDQPTPRPICRSCMAEHEGSMLV